MRECPNVDVARGLVRVSGIPGFDYDQVAVTEKGG